MLLIAIEGADESAHGGASVIKAEGNSPEPLQTTASRTRVAEIVAVVAENALRCVRPSVRLCVMNLVIGGISRNSRYRHNTYVYGVSRSMVAQGGVMHQFGPLEEQTVLATVASPLTRRFAAPQIAENPLTNHVTNQELVLLRGSSDPSVVCRTA